MAASESYPEELRYHPEHDWARIEGDEATLGITWFAQDSLGELVHYEPPADGATIGFSCHSVNRRAWIGPMATDLDAQHGGIGSAVLGALCADLDARGYDAGEISWVSNLRFYGKCGASVSRVFQGWHRTL